MPIECNNLTKSYDGKLVIDHCTATIPEIGVTAIMGPSGVGKTTFLRLLAGLEKADSGHISGLSRKKLSVVFQEDRLFPQLTVLENLQAVGSGAEQWLYRLGLMKAAAQYPDELSGGMKRRVSIGRALCFDGDVFLLDEPFQGLDDSTKMDVMDIFAELKTRKAIVLVTHDHREAEYLAAHILRF
ncbi:ATP-binding cassette domain-containing protein [Fumia xinanensis]|uniref:ATP-binding cassette domain-containing protein n=1 Tax=Fumia xinanensis TaxID=2763659 RepID=A0A926E766_9FIRM|nr:ATP-binding cassette domain-containing protein [Fumia xinanensis]MBC8560426.1 ATP-binding cassette domain-containing protein [Fumia xinanensis]